MCLASLTGPLVQPWRLWHGCVFRPAQTKNTHNKKNKKTIEEDPRRIPSRISHIYIYIYGEYPGEDPMSSQDDLLTSFLGRPYVFIFLWISNMNIYIYMRNTLGKTPCLRNTICYWVSGADKLIYIAMSISLFFAKKAQQQWGCPLPPIRWW